MLETYVEKLSNPSILPAGNWDSDVFYELVCIENINELEMMEERLVTDKSYRNQVVWIFYYNIATIATCNILYFR